jgi:four helix bundle protein
MVNSYKDLIVFQKSKTLTIDVIKYFKKNKTDRSNDFLLNQVFRSVSSVGANLAEGFGRNYSQNFKQFVGIARGSSFETEYCLKCY